jgi:Lysyl oxidase
VISRGRLLLPVLAGLVIAACTPGATGQPEPSASDRASGAANATASPTASPTPEPTPTPEPLIPDNALLPNLVMEPLAEWSVEYDEAGRRLLHVTTVFSNYGVGAFEVRGSRTSADDPVMMLDQVIYTDSGGMRRVPTRVDARYAGDGHNHWHAQQVVTMELSPVLSPGSVTNGNKIHFCFFDNTTTNSALEGYSGTAYYKNRWCGKPTSNSVRMGLSIGYGDRYGWDFVGQYIDISSLAGGTYTLKATVDWVNNFYETDDTDNCTMSRVQIPTAGEGRIITVEASELPCPT